MSEDSGDGAEVGCLAKDMAGLGNNDNGDWMRMSIGTGKSSLRDRPRMVVANTFLSIRFHRFFLPTSSEISSTLSSIYRQQARNGAGDFGMVTPRA